MNKALIDSEILEIDENAVKQNHPKRRVGPLQGGWMEGKTAQTEFLMLVGNFHQVCQAAGHTLNDDESAKESTRY